MKLAQILEQYMPDERAVSEIVDFFSLFSNTIRIRILNLLSISEFCVGDIVFALGENQTTVSHQLRALKDAGLIACKRDGKRIVYYIANGEINDFMASAIQAASARELVTTE